MQRHQRKNGYIALIAAIIIGAVTLTMVITSVYIGITQGMNSLLYSNHMESLAISSACAEEALMNLKNNHDYAGNETLNLGHSQCQILPIENLGGEARVIKTIGTVNGVNKKIKIQISQIDPQMVITSWQEVPDF